MSVDKLQKRIRKLKNPLMVSFPMDLSLIPPQYLNENRSHLADYISYANDLLTALKENVAAVRFDFGSFSVCGPEGLSELSGLLRSASALGYYVLLDAAVAWSPRQAELLADGLMDRDGDWIFDGLLLSGYLGTDGIRPFAERLKDNDKDLFVVLRTGNKSASEIQDLLTGTRLVHTAAADMTKRLGEKLMDRCGYSRIAGVGPATSADVLRNLRSKYPGLFLLIDGLDYPGGNAKICAEGFDELGHGAIACVSGYVTCAWNDPSATGETPVACAVAAVERLKKNLNRHITIL